MNDATTAPLGFGETAEETAARMAVERIDGIVRQRDELAACLREVRHGFIGGAIGLLRHDEANVEIFTQLCTRIDAALLRLDVRERLDDKLQAERNGVQGIADEGRRCPTCGQKLP